MKKGIGSLIVSRDDFRSAGGIMGGVPDACDEASIGQLGAVVGEAPFLKLFEEMQRLAGGEENQLSAIFELAQSLESANHRFGWGEFPGIEFDVRFRFVMMAAATTAFRGWGPGSLPGSEFDFPGFVLEPIGMMIITQSAKFGVERLGLERNQEVKFLSRLELGDGGIDRFARGSAGCQNGTYIKNEWSHSRGNVGGFQKR